MIKCQYQYLYNKSRVIYMNVWMLHSLILKNTSYYYVKYIEFIVCLYIYMSICIYIYIRWINLNITLVFGGTIKNKNK